GDGQADLENHGGEYKAVYAYSLDHYDYWRGALNRVDMPYGQFGENLTISGLDEFDSCIGDQLRIGSALFTITQPRVPCFKLGIRLGDEKMPRLFSESARTGFYLRVPHRCDRGVEAYVRLGRENMAQTLIQALEVPELSPEWRTHIAERLQHSRRGAN
ncbi:MAG TPA: MOSC domain-containing protein, partial [Gammaproteobacteria bacterium]